MFDRFMKFNNPWSVHLDCVPQPQQASKQASKGWTTLPRCCRPRAWLSAWPSSVWLNLSVGVWTCNKLYQTRYSSLFGIYRLLHLSNPPLSKTTFINSQNNLLSLLFCSVAQRWFFHSCQHSHHPHSRPASTPFCCRRCPTPPPPPPYTASPPTAAPTVWAIY